MKRADHERNAEGETIEKVRESCLKRKKAARTHMVRTNDSLVCYFTAVKCFQVKLDERQILVVRTGGREEEGPWLPFEKDSTVQRAILHRLCRKDPPHEPSADEAPDPRAIVPEESSRISIQMTTKIIRELFICMLSLIYMFWIRNKVLPARSIISVFAFSCHCTYTKSVHVLIRQRMQRSASFVCRCVYEEFAEYADWYRLVCRVSAYHSYCRSVRFRCYAESAYDAYIRLHTYRAQTSLDQYRCVMQTRIRYRLTPC